MNISVVFLMKLLDCEINPFTSLANKFEQMLQKDFFFVQSNGTISHFLSAAYF